MSEGAVVDRATNQVSIFNLLEDGTVASFPVILARICVATSFERDSSDSADFVLKFRLKLNNSELISHPMEVNFSTTTMARVFLNFNGVPLVNPGRLTAEILDQERIIGSYSFLMSAAIPQPTVVPPVN